MSHVLVDMNLTPRWVDFHALPEACGRAVVTVLHDFASELAGGAVISVDPGRARVRILPIERGESAES